MMSLSMIWAMDRNWLIGKDLSIPWHIPEDFRHFKETTMGKPVIMGLRTFESLSKPLPGRENIVLNFDPLDLPGCKVATSLQEALDMVKDKEAFVIGGASIYRQFLPYADTLFMTFIDHEFEGNVHFPKFDLSGWKLVSEIKGKRDLKKPYDYYFRKYKKINA